ncbi:hypothetical protein ACHAWF_004029 [Thalassiosira exigua]
MVLPMPMRTRLHWTLQLALTTTVRGMTTTTASRATVAERTYSCSDGVTLATRHWSNFDAGPSDDARPRRARKVLCLHGWLDNAASFNRLAPLLLDSLPSSDGTSDSVPTEVVALDFPGHGLSGHKSVDGPPQLLAEYAYYVSELVEALGWADNNDARNGIGVGRTVIENVNANSKNGKTEGTSTRDMVSVSSDNGINESEHKIILIGHSMGSGVSVVLCAAFPEWFSSVVLLEGGLMGRNARDASRHVRAACQRRLKSNKTLFPDGSKLGEGATPRSKVYGNLDAAIEARLSTTRRMPGDQFLSYEAAKGMVSRATLPASVNGNDDAVVFRHDPRLQWPSLQYYTREQVEAFFHDVHASGIPVCFLWAADGWPVDAWAENAVKNIMKPKYLKRLSGSHHFHADPDSVSPVAQEIAEFIEKERLICNTPTS